MNTHRKTFLILVTVLIFGGIVYLGLKRANFNENASSIENVNREGVNPEQEKNSGVKKETEWQGKNMGSDDTNYTWEDVDGRVGIEKVTVENGEISIKLKNQTKDNTLLFAHLEYVRIEDGKAFSPIRLDFDGPKLEAGKSEELTYSPQKPTGRTGEIKIKELVFQNDKDNYISE